MKKYQIIGFTLWTLENIILTLRMWEYILIAPVLAALKRVCFFGLYLFLFIYSLSELLYHIPSCRVTDSLSGKFGYSSYCISVAALTACFHYMWVSKIWTDMLCVSWCLQFM